MNQISVVSNGASGYNLKCVSKTISDVVICSTNLINDTVAGMWLVYGFDTGNTTSSSISYYYNYIGASTLMNLIRAVRIALLIKSRDEVLATPTTKNFSMFGGPSVQTYGPITDRYIYRMHTFTIPLKQLPIPIPTS